MRKAWENVWKGSRVPINMCIRGNERPGRHGCEQIVTRRPLCTLAAVTSLTLSLPSILPFFSAPHFQPRPHPSPVPSLCAQQAHTPSWRILCCIAITCVHDSLHLVTVEFLKVGNVILFIFVIIV